LPLGEQFRLWLIVATTLASHLLLDSLNNYGVHPFYPIDSAWYFADAVFIFEPSLWLILGIFAAANAASRMARLAAALPIVLLPVAMASLGLVPIESVVLLGIVGAAFAASVRRMSARARAGMALVATLLILAGLFGTSHLARTAARTALTSETRGTFVDVILTPNPSAPLCWGVIGVELNEARGQYVLWRGTLSLAPEWKRPTTCASHRLAEPTAARLIGNGRLALRDEMRQPLRQLRDLAQRDCWTRAWLQFGRAPVIAGGAIFDLRFAEGARRNFTSMPIHPRGPATGCPSNLPNWGMPRADLLK
jgi:inner membrane protein